MKFGGTFLSNVANASMFDFLGPDQVVNRLPGLNVDKLERKVAQDLLQLLSGPSFAGHQAGFPANPIGE